MIREVFQYPAGGKDISLQLMELRQGSDSAADYSIKFRTLGAQSGWNKAALWAVFRGGLNPVLQTELACREEASSLMQFVSTAIRLDNLLRQHQAGAHPPVSARPRVHAEHQRRALIDSGVAVNLIDGALVEELGIPTIPCVGLFHCERLAFYVTSSPVNPVILGFPWLRCHDPQISWCTEELVRWSDACLKECLLEPVSRPCRASLVEDSASLASGRIPRVYEDFSEVFSEERAARLPSHQAWDCAIDLLPNASPPRGRVYPLSLPETKAMEEYIEAALAVGHIRPSTSPAAVGFFFVGKKYGGLRLCIDYRGLNAITVRYPYPLPLLPAALEQLRGVEVLYQVGFT
ncbi:hypothetical protein QTP86_021608 [Hemibagrus guttatus]|nr:hypothetical protein QTP86_021608 [Hemibagrus guttatus]